MKKAVDGSKQVAIVTELEWPLRRHYDIITGIKDYAKANENWTLEVCRFPEARIDAGVHFDGIIGRIDPDTLAVAKRRNIPLVNVMASSTLRAEMTNVLVDVPEAGRMAALHLIKRGLPRLLCIQLAGKRLTQYYTQEVYDLATEHGLPFRVCTLPSDFEGSSESWGIARETLKELKADWAPPIGIVTATDTAAQVVMLILANMGWKSPEDIAVVSMGNEQICTMMEPTLSSVDLGYTRNGYEAASVLAGLMNGEAPPEESIITPPKTLVVRHSSDVFAVRDPEVQKALRFIAENSDQMIGVPEITAATGIGRQTLERRFRAELNTSIYAELHRLRIERCKRLLVEDIHFPIKELHLSCGFATLSNFYNAFQKNTGISPAAYRKAHADPGFRERGV